MSPLTILRQWQFPYWHTVCCCRGVRGDGRRRPLKRCCSFCVKWRFRLNHCRRPEAEGGNEPCRFPVSFSVHSCCSC
ncbi:hypothetical protein D3C73_1367680 [compost metagenome]